MFWLRNEKIKFKLCMLIWKPVKRGKKVFGEKVVSAKLAYLRLKICSSQMKIHYGLFTLYYEGLNTKGSKPERDVNQFG